MPLRGSIVRELVEAAALGLTAKLSTVVLLASVLDDGIGLPCRTLVAVVRLEEGSDSVLTLLEGPASCRFGKTLAGIFTDQYGKSLGFCRHMFL